MARNELQPDPLYVEPFVDVDEWRDEPVRHRYVHGGFTDTDLRFSLYFPPPERYEGRFLQPVMHIAGDENVALTGELAAAFRVISSEPIPLSTIPAHRRMADLVAFSVSDDYFAVRRELGLAIA